MAGNRRGTENIAYLPYKGRLSRPKTKRIPTLCPPPSVRWGDGGGEGWQGSRGGWKYCARERARVGFASALIYSAPESLILAESRKAGRKASRLRGER